MECADNAPTRKRSGKYGSEKLETKGAVEETMERNN
jgi:hypothetical protein